MENRSRKTLRAERVFIRPKPARHRGPAQWKAFDLPGSRQLVAREAIVRQWFKDAAIGLAPRPIEQSLIKRQRVYIAIDKLGLDELFYSQPLEPITQRPERDPQ